MFLTEFGDLRRAIIGQKYVTGGILMCQEQFGKVPSETWEMWHFSSFCPYFSTHPSLKLRIPTPKENTFLELARQWLLSHKI